MSNTQKLAFGATLQEGIAIGTKNIGPILVNVFLWILTIWIPYLNVGTTIGLTTGIVAKASKGEFIPMTEIFDPSYRKYMGEYFTTIGLMMMGIQVALLLFIIPGIVIGLAWSLAPLLVIEKGKNPTEALLLSNNCTYGYKWRMFGICFLAFVAFAILSSILTAIFKNSFSLFMLSQLALYGFLFFVLIGLQASFYKQLTEDV
ncbi:MAG: hypothetical protein FWG12_03990 [Holophagaceae bacterium]|nr:hypothetical protein [Holophagaceae bacterium]